MIGKKTPTLQIHLFLFQVQPLYQAHYPLTEHFKNAHVNTLALKQKLAQLPGEWNEDSFELVLKALS